LPLKELKNSQKVIGSKQVKKAIAKNIVQKVYIADDAEPHVTEPIKKLCNQNQLEVVVVDKMENLGNACGIDVGSATVALINDN